MKRYPHANNIIPNRGRRILIWEREKYVKGSKLVKQSNVGQSLVKKRTEMQLFIFLISLQIWSARSQVLNWNFWQDLVVDSYLNTFS